MDHGKSTLADRLLEITNTIPKEKLHEQFLDQNPISRKRGITIKLAPVRMNYTLGANNYTLNLIDTPGHADFSYEVSRTLAACEGAILLVDATQGIQAQTVAHFKEAEKEELTLIPVLNKIDLSNARTEDVARDLVETFGFKKEEILYISAKTGQNVSLILEAIITRIPQPKGNKNLPLRALIFDAAYDDFRGVVAYVRIIDGQIKKNDKIRFYQNRLETKATDLGYFSPFLASSDILKEGEIGYIIPGIKDIRLCRVGDTIVDAIHTVLPLPGYQIPKPMVFFGMYPRNSNDFPFLKTSLSKLALNDTALTYEGEHSSYLGNGFRVGFLGLLHAEIVKERIRQEFNLDILLTKPQVVYKREKDSSISEPYMKLNIYMPKEFVGAIMNICQERKGTLLDLSYHQRYAVLVYQMPFSMFIRNLSAELKAASNGFVSMDYELIDYKSADLVNLGIKINNIEIDVLSEFVYKDEAVRKASEKALMLKEVLPRQQFRQVIQGEVFGKIVAREEIPPFRKDVLAKMSGGDRRRKDKLLEKQKKGKKKQVLLAKISLPQDALVKLVESV